MFDFSLQLLCTSKPGTLSRLIREINLFGLQYRSHKISVNGEHSHITITASGDLNCTFESLEDLFENFPEVLRVQELHVIEDGKEVKRYRTSVSETHIQAHEHLTPGVLLAAEKRLSEILGPVASFIVESAAQESRNAGELFERMSAELNDPQERAYFMAIIERDRTGN